MKKSIIHVFFLGIVLFCGSLFASDNNDNILNVFNKIPDGILCEKLTYDLYKFQNECKSMSELVTNGPKNHILDEDKRSFLNYDPETVTGFCDEVIMDLIANYYEYEFSNKSVCVFLYEKRHKFCDKFEEKNVQKFDAFLDERFNIKFISEYFENFSDLFKYIDGDLKLDIKNLDESNNVMEKQENKIYFKDFCCVGLYVLSLGFMMHYIYTHPDYQVD